MKRLLAMVCAVAALVLTMVCADGVEEKAASAGEKVIFSFEKDTQGWEIPEWALEQQDYVGESLEATKEVASEGGGSLKFMSDFPGKAWKGAIIEYAEYYDWTPYSAISCDLYIPKDAPTGLKAKMILTVGEEWKFTEMARLVSLVPGQWVTVSANIAVGSEDWKKTVVDDNFRKDVRKIALRIEGNKNPVYNGPIYVDNIKLK